MALNAILENPLYLALAVLCASGAGWLLARGYGVFGLRPEPPGKPMSRNSK